MVDSDATCFITEEYDHDEVMYHHCTSSFYISYLLGNHLFWSYCLIKRLSVLNVCRLNVGAFKTTLSFSGID